MALVGPKTLDNPPLLRLVDQRHDSLLDIQITQLLRRDFVLNVDQRISHTKNVVFAHPTIPSTESDIFASNTICPVALCKTIGSISTANRFAAHGTSGITIPQTSSLLYPSTLKITRRWPTTFRCAGGGHCLYGAGMAEHGTPVQPTNNNDK